MRAKDILIIRFVLKIATVLYMKNRFQTMCLHSILVNAIFLKYVVVVAGLRDSPGKGGTLRSLRRVHRLFDSKCPLGCAARRHIT